ncbi:hypothetical protein GcM3_111025 [Golovinomyces cichoracearum]|uniref:Uncharacterized protein n=1 Tax=Golovinomyces cichoracearum TaxID=62708 RepID=A0A420I8V4_9PEZI|nr:hypothetical protein GcM3_111025 [Golovinomyces cichoracearum]
MTDDLGVKIPPVPLTRLSNYIVGHLERFLIERMPHQQVLGMFLLNNPETE